MPKHWMTSVNSGDTVARTGDGSLVGHYESDKGARTVVPHCDIRYNLLEHRLALDKLLVLGLRCLQLGAKLL